MNRRRSTSYLTDPGSSIRSVEHNEFSRRSALSGEYGNHLPFADLHSHTGLTSEVENESALNGLDPFRKRFTLLFPGVCGCGSVRARTSISKEYWFYNESTQKFTPSIQEFVEHMHDTVRIVTQLAILASHLNRSSLYLFRYRRCLSPSMITIYS